MTWLIDHAIWISVVAVILCLLAVGLGWINDLLDGRWGE